jgi:Flp pilus assembly pilin Flp
MDGRSFLLLLKDDRAQGLVEYALIIALVAMVAVAALRVIGTRVKSTLNQAAGSLLS